MHSLSWTPDNYTFPFVFKACGEISSVRYGASAHALSRVTGFKSNVFVGNALVAMYTRCGYSGDARELFDEMSVIGVWDVVSWNSIIESYAKLGKPKTAVEMLRRMTNEFAFRPDDITLVNVIPPCASLGAHSLGKQLHGFAIRSEIIENMFVGNCLVDMYAKCGMMDDANTVFSNMRLKDVVSWNVMVAGYAQRGLGYEALGVFRQMLSSGVKPNEVTLISVLSGCASVGALMHGKIHAYALRNQQNAVPLFVSNCLIDMYAKCGDIGKGRFVFDCMTERNEVTWTSLMTGYGMHGYGEEALGIFDEMWKMGFKLDGVTLLVVLYACSHSGMIDEGMEYFNRMETDFGVSPGPEHYACMVDLLGRAGRLDAALRLIEEMPMEPPPVVWVALLSCCRIHGKVELGEYAAKKITELASNNDGSYTLLSNIYASTGRWKDVARVRSLMRHKGVKKRPGCSWVEGVKGTTTFFVGDKTHPRANEIHQVLSDHMQRIKDIGYVPEKDFALHDVDDEEKGDLLLDHSEKLALAYGILTTSQGAAIRITKNLRVCGDCHTAFTYISRIIDHEIILRDSSRFHHFKNGMCSCKGYW
ncbi:hypothetical protein DY000_02018806 [Brassica cretica]|uniref:DYW domain-containing protein n=1 Tax=Brassica cretica TaxID=69181 RepID=A0ABQ7D354_BRACR|nr:hypothetical protein DY000_02018806 [Brassica cretica]